MANAPPKHVSESAEQKFATETTLNTVQAIFYCSVTQ